MGKGARPRHIAKSMGGPVWIIAVDDDVFDAMAASVSEALARVGPVQVVRASEFSDPATQADLYYGGYQPTTLDCQKILDYSAPSGQVWQFEQDAKTGAVYRRGTLVWPTAPLAVQRFDTALAPAGICDMALYFAKGRQNRVTSIPDVLVVHRPFTTRLPAVDEVVVPNWSEHARAMLSPTGQTPAKKS